MSIFNVPSGTYLAATDISPSVFVVMGTSDYSVSQGSTGDFPIGISQEGTNAFNGTLAAASGQTINVYRGGSECLLRLGTTVVAGQKLGPDASGQGIVVTTADYGARALEGGASGAIVRVQVWPGETA